MSAQKPVRAYLLITGRVQRVAYRAFAREEATLRGVRGWVRNRDDGRVEAEVEGEQAMVDAFVESLKQGPPLARIDHVEVQWMTANGQDASFRILY